MTSHARPLTTQIDPTALLRHLVAWLVAFLIIAGATWLALAPTTVLEVEGAVIQKWIESVDGKTALYWIEIAGPRGPQRCSFAAYQTQLIPEWEAMVVGQAAAMTCYGSTAVHLSPTP